MIEEILRYNKEFVKSRAYEPYVTNKYPDKKLAVLTCMDTRLIELLPAALGIRNGDAKIIKNAGGVITHPYGECDEEPSGGNIGTGSGRGHGDRTYGLRSAGHGRR